MKRAIYLSGGGARGAYQAGVLKGIQEILDIKHLPVDILSSVSAGSINAAYLAMHTKNFDIATNNLVKIWSSLSCDKVFKTGNLSLLKSIMRNIVSMILHYQPKNGGYLLDTSPLKKLVDSKIDFNQINHNIAEGLLDFEVAATCYDTAETISFINSSQQTYGWKSIRHHSRADNIANQHIMASAAFPLFFPAVKINDRNYGDGGIRLSSPLRGSIRLGADNILVIGTRARPKQIDNSKQIFKTSGTSFASIFGNMMNALFLDNLDRDVEMITKINNALTQIPPSNRNKSKWRNINVLCIRPSIDIGELAADKIHHLPIFLRYLMGAFGSKAYSGDFLSFLLFESAFSKPLIDLGYRDAFGEKDKILNFFDNRAGIRL